MNNWTLSFKDKNINKKYAENRLIIIKKMNNF